MAFSSGGTLIVSTVEMMQNTMDLADPYHPVMDNIDVNAFQGFRQQATPHGPQKRSHLAKVFLVQRKTAPEDARTVANRTLQRSGKCAIS